MIQLITGEKKVENVQNPASPSPEGVSEYIHITNICCCLGIARLKGAARDGENLIRKLSEVEKFLTGFRIDPQDCSKIPNSASFYDELMAPVLGINTRDAKDLTSLVEQVNCQLDIRLQEIRSLISSIESYGDECWRDLFSFLERLGEGIFTFRVRPSKIC